MFTTCYSINILNLQEYVVLRKTVLLRAFIVCSCFFLMGTSTTSPAGADDDRDLTVTYCKPKWSADGTQIRQTFARSTANCGYGAEQIAFVADYVLEVICTPYKCSHISEMTVDEKAHYDELRMAPNSGRDIGYVRCIHRTPDNKLFHVLVMYKHLFNSGNGESCDEKNTIRTYSRESRVACVRELGCISLYFVDREGTEYDRLKKRY